MWIVTGKIVKYYLHEILSAVQERSRQPYNSYLLGMYTRKRSVYGGEAYISGNVAFEPPPAVTR